MLLVLILFFNKPDPRHLTDVIEIIGGDLKKTLWLEQWGWCNVCKCKTSVLVKDGYTEKSENEIKHDNYFRQFWKNYLWILWSFLCISNFLFYYVCSLVLICYVNCFRIKICQNTSCNWLNIFFRSDNWFRKFIFNLSSTSILYEILCFYYISWKMIGSFNMIEKETGRHEALFSIY